MVRIRKGRKEDLDQIIEIFDKARKFMRASGNVSQWSDGYPGAEHILNDMAEGNNYVGIDDEGDIVMTFAFIIGEEPTYKVIEGKWLNDKNYGTIHRIASSGKISGVVKTACEYCFNHISDIRIDTHEKNHKMQQALENLNFEKCGIIICRDGTPRIAYQKSISHVKRME